ncbi:MAG: phosphoribosylformylglycinamidine synthase subunit PurS [Robiginitomaculum sp.]|nr:phosphoribosylformylglycinamidine synthase subunit PurS [Robiginitomaculum sp.]
MKAIIHIGLKPGVLDPQGRTIARSLSHLGFKSVMAARQGKTIELDLEDGDKSAAETHVKDMCEKLLANTVIEDYRFEIVD